MGTRTMVMTNVSAKRAQKQNRGESRASTVVDCRAASVASARTHNASAADAAGLRKSIADAKKKAYALHDAGRTDEVDQLVAIIARMERELEREEGSQSRTTSRTSYTSRTSSTHTRKKNNNERKSSMAKRGFFENRSAATATKNHTLAGLDMISALQ